ncbi:histidine phosphatase family protein [Falsiroseomonas sp. E2-1-a4]|uniref:histidine phosphatase family protein n=1 Tax=Falsiroseomonas sp. E2-1-a4 TaxID=3239299 RepID=UPI003F307B77
MALALPALLAVRAEAATARGEDAAALVAALRRGGVVVVLRHAITDRSQFDRGDRSNRAGQRNLSEAGRAQSRALGRAFAYLPIGQVLTSPVFRALDTAELAFGARALVEPRLTADDYTHDPALLTANIAWLRDRIRRPSAPDTVDVLVGHIVPLGMVLRCGLSQAEYPEGALAVFAPGGRLLGVLAAETLGAALSPAAPASGTPPPR